jgi:hypothetical protein
LLDGDFNAKCFGITNVGDSILSLSQPGFRDGMTKLGVLSFTLGKQDVAFLRIEHLSIVAASRGAKNIPILSRALGMRLSPAFRRVTLLFSVADAHELLSNINSNAMIAAVFSVPSTHQTLQLKGSDASVGKAMKNDFKLVTSYTQSFADHLAKLGHPKSLTETMLACEPDDLAAVTFTPSAAFSQTPGPKAGYALGLQR